MAQKLKGIYDALDHGNYKSACKLCATFLQKHPQHAVCKSLYGVALERCCRRDEALQQCEEALKTDGTDDTVLSTVQVVYKRCHELVRIIMMYESASAQQPDNEDLASNLFASAVRGSDFAKSQQVATRLYSKFKKAKYLHWIVVSLLLQQQQTNKPKTGADPLALATMMLRKAPVNAEVPPDDAEIPFSRGDQHLLLLHLTVMRLSGEHAKALQMLEERKSLIKLAGDFSAMRARFLADSGDVQQALREVRSAVVRNPDCWASAQEYIDLAFKCPLPAGALPRVACAESAGGADIPDHGSRFRRGEAIPHCIGLSELEGLYTDDEVWNAFLLFKHFQQQGVGRGRVSQLAELELRRRAFCANEDEAASVCSEAPCGVTHWREVIDDRDWTDFIRCIEQYVARHGAKNYCFFDLKPFFHIIQWSDMATILGEAKEGSEGFVARAQYACQRHGNTSAPSSIRQLAENAARWFGRWSASQATEHAEKELGNTGPLAYEEFLLLSLVSLLDMDKATSMGSASAHRAYMMDAITIAEMEAPSLPHCFHVNVLLVLLYGALGCPERMMKYYAKMDTKNIQHETLAYLVFDALSECGSRDDVRHICRSILYFHEDMEKDSTDAINLAFRTGIYNRIPEYVNALAKVGNSVLWGRAVVDEALLDLGQAQTLDTLIEGFAKHSLLLARIARSDARVWEVHNQDRDLLNGLRVLPLCTARESSHHMSVARRTMSVMGAAHSWETAPRASATSSPCGSSAAEALLSRGLRVCPGSRLRISASILWFSSLLLQHGATCQTQLSEALDAARQAFATLGIGAESTLLSDDTQMLYRPWQCALVVCQAAELITISMSLSEPRWRDAEAKLNATTAYVQAVVGHLRKDVDGDSPAQQLSASFAEGGEIIKHVRGFVNVCVAAILPIALWCATALPKAGSGKKIKDGQEGCHAVRVALRNLLTGTQSTLTEIQAGLRAAATDIPSTSHRCGLWVRPAQLDEVLGAEAARVSEIRDRLRAEISEGHTRLLLEASEAISPQLALLKSRGTFKP